jgi:osmotically-inducible protein OsmY
MICINSGEDASKTQPKLIWINVRFGRCGDSASLICEPRFGVVSDLELRRIVLDELEFEPGVDGAHIGVVAEKGVATLTGFVRSYAEKLSAERAARQIEGVKAIAQEIEVRLPSHTKHAYDEIAARAVNILKWQVGLPADLIMVKVERGIVTLSGEVEWRYQKTDAEEAVHKLSGVIEVLNQIRIVAPLRACEVKETIQKAPERNAELEAVGITVHTEGGKVQAWRERDLVEQAAWSAPGVTAVEDRLTIEPRPRFSPGS